MFKSHWPQIYPIYQKHGFDPLTSGLPVMENNSRINLDYYREKVISHKKVNGEIVSYIKSASGENSREYILADIFSNITEGADNLFLNRVRQNYFGLSDVNQNPDGEILKVINYLAELTSHPNPDLYPEDILILTDIIKIMEADRPDATIPLIMHAEQLALKLFRSGLPVILCLGDTFYSNSKAAESKHLSIETDLRLIFPGNVDNLSTMEKVCWEYLKNMHHQQSAEPQLNGLIGEWMMGAGSQLVAATTGERFYSDGYTISINLFKSLPIIRKLFGPAGKDAAADLSGYLILLDLLHEQGHTFFHDPKYEETDADLTAVTGAVMHCPQLGLDTEIMLLCILGEYLMQAESATTGHGVFDSYQQSGIFIIGKLDECGLVKLNGNKLAVNPDPDNIRNLTGIMLKTHDQVHQGFDIDRNINSESIRQYLRIIKPA
jgi:hypothetical protein